MSAPPLPPPPPGLPDENKNALLFSVIWVECALSLGFVGTRVYVRKVLLKGLWWDDWTMCFAMLVILAFTILASVYGALGGTRHIYFLEDTELQTAIKLFWIANVLLVASLCFGKVSVALLLQRLLPRTAKYKRWFLWFVSTSLTLIFIFVTAVILGQCQPVEALWLAAPGTCWNKDAVNGWNLFAGSYYTFMDFVLGLFPILFLYNLQLSLKKKLLLSSLLGVGLLAGVCAIVKTTYLPTLQSEDFTWNTTVFLIWNATEANIIVICACVPTLQPLMPRFWGSGRTGNRSGARAGQEYYGNTSKIKSKAFSSRDPTASTHEAKSRLGDNDSDEHVSNGVVPLIPIHRRVDFEVTYENQRDRLGPTVSERDIV